MSAVGEAIRRRLRGPRASRLLARLGIDAGRYWLLVDLLEQLSERGEMLDQLGSEGVALKAAAWLYFAMSVLMSLLLVAAQPAPATYRSSFLVFTGVLLLSILLSETGNSLVNPVEGLVLAHQPVNGATYTAAKLTHLARILLYLIPGLNAAPALGGLFLRDATWTYPWTHLLLALGTGIVCALLCCAVFGWLMRVVPVRRLRAAGQFAASIPLLAMLWWQPMRNWLSHADVSRWLPTQPAARWGLAVACGVAAAGTVALGIRSLSADYLIRVSSLVHGASRVRRQARRSRFAEAIAHVAGGQPGRAGFAFVRCMMLRDWQFRRHAVQTVIPAMVGLAPLIPSGSRTDPFSGPFTAIHLVPHVLGMALFLLCMLLPYGGDYKGAWIFLMVPQGAFRGFARGVHALLWIWLAAAPQVVLFVFLAWRWGVWHAGLFLAYSVAIVSLFLAIDLRFIDAAPFSKQPDASRGAAMLPVMILGGIAISIVVALQHFLLFRSEARVAAATVLLGGAGYLLTRNSLDAFAASMRYHLGLVSAEGGKLYREIR